MPMKLSQASHRISYHLAGSRLETGRKTYQGEGTGLEQNWEVASRNWGRWVWAKVLQAGK